jgi:uncharacterized iron-regulated membrane protein
VEIDLPAKPGQAYVVQQVRRSWTERQDAATVDSVTGRVVSVLRFADWPVAAKLARWGVDAPMGLLFGLANQVALVPELGASLAAFVAVDRVLAGGLKGWRSRDDLVTGPGLDGVDLKTVQGQFERPATS